jgi:hypothetical protein
MSQQINLFNPIFLRQKKYFSALTMLQALAFVLVAMLALYAFEAHQSNGLVQLQIESERQVTERRNQLVQFSKDFSVQGTSKLLEDEIARVESQLKKRQALLSELGTGVGGNTEGFSPYLSAFARQPLNGVWLTALAIGGKSNELVVKGRVLNGDLLPAYIQVLNREPALMGLAIAEMRLDAKGGDADGAAVSGSTPGVVPAGLAPQKGSEPAKYVEFSFSMPLRGAEPEAPAGAKPVSPPGTQKGAQ